MWFGYECVWKLCTPKPNGFHDHYPYISLLNGYFIGNIPYFQTNPCVALWPGVVLMVWLVIILHPTWNAWESGDFVEEDLRAQLREMEAGASEKDKVEAPNGILGFLKWGYPKLDGLYMKNRLKMDDFGIPQFQETSIWYVFQAATSACTNNMSKKNSQDCVTPSFGVWYFLKLGFVWKYGIPNFDV